MKQTLIICCLLFFSSCAKTVPTATQQSRIDYVRNGKVNFITSSKGLFTVSSENTAETMNQAVYFAEINALENILFRGIQGSSQENPMISDEMTAKRENPAALRSLISENGYHIFVTESEVIEKFKGSPITVIQRVTFDIPALRKYLEKNNIIRKFGL